MYRITALILLLTATLASAGTAQEQTYLQPEAFVSGAFDANTPDPQLLWVVGEIGEQAEKILGHAPNKLRERYWQRGGRSVWILEEIGKERLFTVGWVIEDGEITDAKVLIYRETRGWEVRFPFFTRQFTGASLTEEQQLNQHIDGISGATLSVRAMRRMAELALLLDSHVQQKHAAR